MSYRLLLNAGTFVLYIRIRACEWILQMGATIQPARSTFVRLSGFVAWWIFQGCQQSVLLLRALSLDTTRLTFSSSSFLSRWRFVLNEFYVNDKKKSMIWAVNELSFPCTHISRIVRYLLNLSLLFGYANWWNISCPWKFCRRRFDRFGSFKRN